MSGFTHRIRLRRPWLRLPQGERVIWRRWFGRPRRLASDEQVWLVLEEFAVPVRAVLNGEALGTSLPPGPAAFAVTALLQARNELALELPGAGGEPIPAEIPPGGVCLEIRRGVG